MAEDELSVVVLLDNYYRDSFGRVVFVIACVLASIILLIAISVYLFINKPPPTTFRVANEWRVLAPVPIDQPYLTVADMSQWVANVLPSTFNLSYMHMDDQLESFKKYFTDNGYQVFLSQLANYVDKTTMVANKEFSHGSPTGAPTVTNQGVLSGRYAWWVQLPVNINYDGLRQITPVDLRITVLVVRAETTNNLTGILIDNVIVENAGLRNTTTGPGNT